MNFEFATAQRIIFGSGSVREAGKAAGGLGRKAFLVRGSNAARAEALMDICRASGVEIVGACEVRTEPTITIAVEGARLARVSGAELVLGFGGGSVLDSAKAIAALATNIGDPLDYLEVVGRGQPLRQTPLPCMAIPTTAGTGSEVTRNAVLSAPEHRVKVSIRSPAMLPLVALVDPELTRGAPRTVITASGMDALTQLIEPFLSSRANPLVDALCREALPRAASALRMFASGEFDNAQAREEMSFASLCGGLALANAGLGAVHGFAGPFGGMFGGAHGAICATLLPHVLEANLAALRSRQSASAFLARFSELAQMLTGSSDPADAIRLTRELCQSFGFISLRSLGANTAEYPSLIERALNASSMRGNPIELTRGELLRILEAAS